MKYILLSTTEQYSQLNQYVSSSRGYPYRVTSLYAPEIPEVVSLPQLIPDRGNDGEILPNEYETTFVDYYKFPLADDIMHIIVAIAGKTIYNEDGTKFFEHV